MILINAKKLKKEKKDLRNDTGVILRVVQLYYVCRIPMTVVLL